MAFMIQHVEYGKNTDGILRCSRYAFGPNRLHYCGPDRNSQIYTNITEGISDPDLSHTLTQFETMYPYLVHIATANHIQDPLDDRVVEAYWIGNALLEHVDKQSFYEHLVDGLGLKKKLGKSFALVEEKIGHGAVPHHSFHVLDIWKRTGRVEQEHTLESMDECRVGWGKVLRVSGPQIVIETESLTLVNGKLVLGLPHERSIMRKLEADYDIEQLKPGNIVSIHWGVICEVLTPHQQASLRRYTLQHMALANETL